MMNTTRRLCLRRLLRAAGLMPLFALVQVGGQALAADAGSQLTAFVEKTQSATGRFEQTGAEQSPGGNTSGLFAFSRPGRFRWEVTDPYPQLLVADGEQVFFHDIDLNQVTVRPMSGALGATPTAILFGRGAVSEQFSVTEEGERDGLQWLSAVPHEKEAGFEKIRIGFSDSLPVAMEVLDSFSRTSTFRFSQIQPNPTIDPGQFQFKPPPGADVVRQ